VNRSESWAGMSATALLEMERICAAFEAEWKSGQIPQLSDFVGSRPEPLRSTLLKELLFLDLEYRLRAGQRPSGAVYCRQFPNDVALVQAVLTEALHRAVRPSSPPPPQVSAAPESDAPQLRMEVVAGPHRGQEFLFAGHESFIIGRARCAHFQLPRRDPYFSRIHLIVEVNPPCCRLYDMGSTNGTFVNGKRVETADLHDGDVIQGGQTVVTVSLLGNWSICRKPSAPSPGRMAAGEEPPEPAPTATYRPAMPKGAGIAQIPVAEAPVIQGYQIHRPLGRGGMGVVYLASRQSDGAPVAIKVIRPAVSGSHNQAQRFLREAGILQKLCHPNIVGFHEMGQAGDVLYFAMDYVSGTDARQLVARLGPLPVARAVRLFRQALVGLSYAHQSGFVHRDIKPSNLLIGTAEGAEVCRLADFGLARVYQVSALSGLTLLGDVGGTLPFMPPEQITHYRDARPPVDQYAAAATLYFLLTGHFLFDFGDLPDHQRLAKVLGDEPVPIRQRRPELPEPLARAIHRALAKEPRRRFPDVAAFHEALAPSA